MDASEQAYQVVIIGGGASGTALLYTLAKYTNIPKILLLEKYDRPGQVNSRASNNSQTLHIGDIETNYSAEKVRQVKPASLMVVEYASKLEEKDRAKIIFPTQKMVLAIGEKEVAMLEERYEMLRPIFPNLKKLSRHEIGEVEPAIVAGRDLTTPLLALFCKDGHAVNFEELAQSFVDESRRLKPDIAVRYSSTVDHISKRSDGLYDVCLVGGERIISETVVVDADSYSLYFAKQLGYGKNFSLIPIGGSFYFSKKQLNGKVYTMQEPLLPFAAVHGDPDVCVPDVTRWGPTARFYPVLESGNTKTSRDYFKTSGLSRGKTWISFCTILLEPVRFIYLAKNMLYEIPWVGRRLFVHNVQKIVPTMRSTDLTLAKGYGGMRLQRINTDTRELELGEGKIIGDNIIFNMTPSPGASVCLFNALRDTEQLIRFFDDVYSFKKGLMEIDLIPSKKPIAD